jgi:uncharacterized coiled-coil protein SlyX
VSENGNGTIKMPMKAFLLLVGTLGGGVVGGVAGPWQVQGSIDQMRLQIAKQGEAIAGLDAQVSALRESVQDLRAELRAVRDRRPAAFVGGSTPFDVAAPPEYYSAGEEEE